MANRALAGWKSCSSQSIALGYPPARPESLVDSSWMHQLTLCQRLKSLVTHLRIAPLLKHLGLLCPTNWGDHHGELACQSHLFQNHISGFVCMTASKSLVRRFCVMPSQARVACLMAAALASPLSSAMASPYPKLRLYCMLSERHSFRDCYALHNQRTLPAIAKLRVGHKHKKYG